MSGHLIKRVRFTPDVSLLECRCGQLLEAPTPEAIARGFQEHRIEVGARRGIASAAPRSDGMVAPWALRKRTTWRRRTEAAS